VYSAPITVVAGEVPQRKTCKPDERMDSSGACVPQEAAARLPRKPAPHREAAHVRRPPPGPVRAWAYRPAHSLAYERGSAPAGQPAASSRNVDNTGCMPVSPPAVSAYYAHDTWSSGLCK
jgi:hypothetical protein